MMRSLLLALACVTTACRDSTAGAVATRTVGDTTFVVSPADGTDGPVRLEILQRLAPDSVEFSRVDAGAFGPAGTLWIFDGAAERGAQVYRVDSAGRHATRVGREGSGPGEYRAPLRLFALADGAMLVKEMSTPRAVRIARDGTVRATFDLPPKAAGWVVTPDTSGGWFITVNFEENRPERIGRFGWWRFDSTGVVIDTVHPPAYMLAEPTPDGIAPGRIRTVGRDESVLTTVPGPNRLLRYARNGRVTAMEWPGEPPAYGADERADVQRAEDRMSELLGKAKASLPAHKEVSHRILTDAQGGIWAQLPTAAVRIPDEELSTPRDPLTIPWREHDRWARFTSDGALQFIVDLPVGARMLDRDGDRILGVLADASGAEQVVVWRVVRLSAK